MIGSTRTAACLCAMSSFALLGAPEIATAQVSPGSHGPAVATAPSTDTAPALQSPPVSTAQLQEIVVTAQRRSENLQNVPISVTAINGAGLERAGIGDTKDLQLAVPGLTFAEDTGTAEISIRGVGTGYSGPGLEGSVALYVDNTYFPTQSGANQALVDVKQIEVLKGPQGTLYGRNATGGAVVVSTQEPIQGRTTGTISAGYGNYNEAFFQGVFNTPLTDTLTFRMAADYERHDGYLHDTFTGKHIDDLKGYLIRPELAWRPIQNFTAIAKYEFSSDYSRDNLRSERLSGADCLGCILSPGGGPATGFYTTVQSAPIEQNLVTAHLGSLRLLYNYGDLALTSTTAYRAVRVDGCADQDAEPGILEQVCNVDGGRRDRSFTEEVGLASSFKGPLNFTSGGSYEFDDNFFGLSIFGSALGGLTPIEYNRDRTKAWAVFGELYYTIVPHLKLTIGGRYDEDDRFHGFHNNADGILIFQETGNQQTASFTNFTPRVVLAYDAGPANFYVSYNKGFKAGGFNSPSSNTAAPVQPETITAYEGGVKSRVLDGRLRANLSIFHYDWSNLQVSYIDPTTGGLNTQNAAAAKNDGAEFSLDATPLSGLTLSVGGVAMHSRYTSFPSAAVYVFNTAAGAGLVNAPVDAAGDPTPRAPRFSGDTSADYTFKTAGGWKLDFSGIFKYTTSYQFDADAGGPLQFDRQKSFELLNLNASAQMPDGHFSFSVYMNNVAQTHYADIRNTTAFGGYEVVGDPRTFGFRGTYRF